MIDEKIIPDSALPFHPAKQGAVVGGAVGVLFLLVLYAAYRAGMEAFVNVSYWGSFVPYLFLMLLIRGWWLRQSTMAVIPMRSALAFAFMGYVVYEITLGVGNYILYNLVDPNLAKNSFQLMGERGINIMKRMNAPQAEIEAARRDLAVPVDMNVKTIVSGVGYSLLFGFVKSLLVALAVRRESRTNP